MLKKYKLAWIKCWEVLCLKFRRCIEEVDKSSCFVIQVNGTGQIISSDVMSGGRSSVDEQNSQSFDVRSRRKVKNDDENERFSKSRSIQEAPTSNYPNENFKNLWNLDHKVVGFKRPETNSTISLPDYNELKDVETHDADNKKPEVSNEKPPKKSIKGSLSLETILCFPQVLPSSYFSFCNI